MALSSDWLIEQVKQRVADRMHVRVDELESSSRRREYVQARQIVAHLCWTVLDSSMTAIGESLGNRHRKTVHHSLEVFRRRASGSTDFQRMVAELERETESLVTKGLDHADTV